MHFLKEHTKYCAETELPLKSPIASALAGGTNPTSHPTKEEHLALWLPFLHSLFSRILQKDQNLSFLWILGGNRSQIPWSEPVSTDLAPEPKPNSSGYRNILQNWPQSLWTIVSNFNHTSTKARSAQEGSSSCNYSPFDFSSQIKPSIHLWSSVIFLRLIFSS